jgi:hypothetical protein
MTFQDITSDQINSGNAAISIPFIAVSHLPIIATTPKAICIEINNSSWVHQSVKKVWIPISQINVIKSYTKANFVDSNPENSRENCLYFEVELPQWLISKNNL